jgi:hypothetical protein
MLITYTYSLLNTIAQMALYTKAKIFFMNFVSRFQRPDLRSETYKAGLVCFLKM